MKSTTAWSMAVIGMSLAIAVGCYVTKEATPLWALFFVINLPCPEEKQADTEEKTP